MPKLGPEIRCLGSTPSGTSMPTTTQKAALPQAVPSFRAPTAALPNERKLFAVP